MRKLWAGIMACLCVGSIAYARFERGPLEDKTAPDFTLKSPEGKALSLKDLKGKPVLINFYSEAWGACMQEFPALQKVNTTYAPKGLRVLGITQDDAASIARVKKSHKATFIILVDADGKVADKYEVSGIPRTLIIDKEGVIKVDLEGGEDFEGFKTALKKVGL